MPTAIIEAPQGLSPSGQGLIGSAYPSPETGDRWEGGFGFVPENCSEPESWLIPCVGPGGTGGPGVAVTENRGANTTALEFTPYIVRSSFTCTAQQKEAIDFEARANRIFDLGESKLLETELYRGDLGTSNLSLSNPNLAIHPNANLSPGGATTPTLGIRALIQAAAHAAGGARAMIHATPATAMAWVQSDSIVLDRSGRWITRVGEHVVVVGTGYSGEGPGVVAPGGSIHWAWVTSPVYLLRGAEKQVIYEFDRDASDGTAIVQRTACAYWDNCLHAGIPIETMGTIV